MKPYQIFLHQSYVNVAEYCGLLFPCCIPSCSIFAVYLREYTLGCDSMYTRAQEIPNITKRLRCHKTVIAASNKVDNIQFHCQKIKKHNTNSPSDFCWCSR